MPNARRLPTATAATGEPCRPAPAPIHLRPHTVSAQKNPLARATMFPRTGSGAVATGASTPMKKRANPRPNRHHEAHVLRAHRLLQQPWTQHQQIERRGGLQVDGIGGSGEAVGQYEERETGCVRKA